MNALRKGLEDFSVFSSIAGRQRRSMRSTGEHPFLEGSVQTSRGRSVIEIQSGPPNSVLQVRVGGLIYDLELDPSGGGRIQLDQLHANDSVQVFKESSLLLLGQGPAAPQRRTK